MCETLCGTLALFTTEFAYMKKEQQERAMTPKQQEVHARVEARWHAKQATRQPSQPKLTQTSAAKEMGVTQSAVQQWLSGKVPIGPIALLRFARILEVNVTELDPEWALTDLAIAELNKDDLALVAQLLALPKEKREPIAAMIRIATDSESAE